MALVFFCLISVPSRSIQVVALGQSSLFFMAEQYSSVCVCVCVCVRLTFSSTHPSMDRHLGDILLQSLAPGGTGPRWRETIPAPRGPGHSKGSTKGRGSCPQRVAAGDISPRASSLSFPRVSQMAPSPEITNCAYVMYLFLEKILASDRRLHTFQNRAWQWQKHTRT